MLIKLFSFSKKYFLPILILSVIFALSSLLWTSDVHHYQDHGAHIKLGFPLDFYSQDHSQEDLYFMTKDKNEGLMLGGNTSYPSSFYWSLFLANIVIVQIVFTGILFLVHSFIPRADYFFRFLSVKYILLVLSLFLAVIIGPKFIPISREQLVSPEMLNPVVPPSFVVPTPSPNSGKE